MQKDYFCSKSSGGVGLPWLWSVHLDIIPGKHTDTSAEAARELKPRLSVFRFDSITQY